MFLNLKNIPEIDQKKFFINTYDQKELISKIIHKLSQNNIASFTCNYLYLGSIYYMLCDKKFYRSITYTDSVHLDGFAIGKIFRILYKKDICDFTPKDFLGDILRYCLYHNKKVFIIGSYAENGIIMALKSMRCKYKGLKIEGIDGFSKNKKSIEMINLFKPDLLVVGLGLNTQEKWIYQNRNILKAKVIISVGNYIDILAGRVNYPAEVYKNLHIRWLRRLIKEPNRVWKRYLGGSVSLSLIFIFHYLKSANYRNRKKDL